MMSSQTNFTNFSQNTQKPSNFIINKGVVKVVNSTENFWIRYKSSDAGFVECNVENSNLNVKVSKDNVEVTVNLNQIQQCKVDVGAGVVDVYETCPASSITLHSGNMKVHTNKASTGIVNAKVNTGLLSNNSDLANISSESHSVGVSNIFGFNFFVPGMSGLSNSVSLIGDLDGFTSNFTVGSGTFDIGI